MALIEIGGGDSRQVGTLVSRLLSEQAAALDDPDYTARFLEVRAAGTVESHPRGDTACTVGGCAYDGPIRCMCSGLLHRALLDPSGADVTCEECGIRRAGTLLAAG